MKTIYNKITASFIAAVSALSLTGCTDLSEETYSVLTSEKHEFTETELKATFAPVYSSLRDVYWGWFGMSDTNDMSSDVWGVPSRIGIGWGDLYVSMHKHEFNSDLDFFEVCWNNNYAGVNACNKILAYEQVQNNVETNAQIRAYRALYYYNLFDLFRNIPLDTEFAHEDGWLPEQSKPEATFAWIEKELLEVADNCGESVEFGKLNKYTAYMILAKLYLNHDAWFPTAKDSKYYQKCIDVLDIIINSGRYSLAANYKDNFKEDISSSPEIIFGIPFENKYAGGNYMANLWMHNAGRATWNFSGWATGGGIVFPQFLDIYEEGDSRYTDTWLGGPQYDINGQPIYLDGEQLNYSKELHSIDNPGCYPMESYRLQKFEILSGDFGTSYDDVAYYRYADVLMMKAECLLRLGGYNGETEEDAARLVSQVRARAFKSDPSRAKVTAAQLKAGSKYKYGHRENQGELGGEDKWIITEEGGDDIELGGLLDELGREFVCENHRRSDIIRFNIKGSNNMNVYCGKSWFCKDAEADRHSDIFPIPRTALNGNSKLKQNPGYGTN